MKQFILLGFLVALVSGCGKSSAPSAPEPVVQNPNANFAWITQNVLAPSCVKCHNDGHAAGGVNLSAFAKATAGGLVTAGNPDASPLYTAIASGRMPMKAPKLSDDKIQAVRDWIQGGARNE